MCKWLRRELSRESGCWGESVYPVFLISHVMTWVFHGLLGPSWIIRAWQHFGLFLRRKEDRRWSWPWILLPGPLWFPQLQRGWQWIFLSFKTTEGQLPHSNLVPVSESLTPVKTLFMCLVVCHQLRCSYPVNIWSAAPWTARTLQHTLWETAVLVTALAA